MKFSRYTDNTRYTVSKQQQDNQVILIQIFSYDEFVAIKLPWLKDSKADSR